MIDGLIEENNRVRKSGISQDVIRDFYERNTGLLTLRHKLNTSLGFLGDVEK